MPYEPDCSRRGPNRLRFGVDAEGAEVLEMEDGEAGATRGPNTIVMMKWEQPYMEALVDALGLREGADAVCEIGFGLGYSASAIQRRRPARHVVIEPDSAVLERAHAWAEEARRANPDGTVEIVPGFWQQVLQDQGKFDAVFLDDFPLPLDRESGAAADGDGSDEEARRRERRQAQRDERRILGAVGSRWHAFLDFVLSHHLRPGGRVTGYLSEDLDLGRPGCTYTRTPIQVQVPTTCTYAVPGTQTYFVPLLRLVDEGHASMAVVTGRRRGDKEIFALDDAAQGGGGGVGKKRSKRQRMADFVMAARGEEGDVGGGGCVN